MVAGHEGRTPHRGSDYGGRVGAQSVGLGERPGHDDRQVASPVGLAVNPDKRLSRHLLDRVSRQQDREGVVLGDGSVEHSASDTAAVSRGLLPRRQGAQARDAVSVRGVLRCGGGVLLGHVKFSLVFRSGR